MEPVADNAEPLPLGQVLAQERERQGLSRTEIAQRLHMSAYQVEALEGGDYTRLPKGTFLKGFVRNYAKVLGLASDKMLSRLAEAAPRLGAPGIVVPTQNIRFDPIGDRFANPYVKAAILATVGLVVAIAAMYWWLFIRPTPPGAAKKPVAASMPSPQNIAPAPVPAAEPVVLRPAPIVAEPPEKAAPPKVEAPKVEPRREAPKPQPVASIAAGGTLKFHFKGSSWVEIKDGRGKVLLSRLNLPGSETEVSGRPPFNVIVGNAPEVQMTYNDRDFPLEPHTKVAVARFTVE